jgi:hypothetical protein
VRRVLELVKGFLRKTSNSKIQTSEKIQIPTWSSPDLDLTEGNEVNEERA